MKAEVISFLTTQDKDLDFSFQDAVCRLKVLSGLFDKVNSFNLSRINKIEGFEPVEFNSFYSSSFSEP